MKLLYGLAGIAILVSALPPVSTNAQGPSGIIISEINWAGSEKSQADEWLELVNLTDTALDISGWLLVGAATGGDAIALPEATILAAKDTLLIANYLNSDLKSTLGTEPDLVTTALSLANSSLQVFLTDPHGLVHDAYEDTGTPDFGSTSPITSMERNLATQAWQSSTTTLGLTVETQFGTPGYALFETLIVDSLPPSDDLDQSEVELPLVIETPVVSPVILEETVPADPPLIPVDPEEVLEVNPVEQSEEIIHPSVDEPYEFLEIIAEEISVAEPLAVVVDDVQPDISLIEAPDIMELIAEVPAVPEPVVDHEVGAEPGGGVPVIPKRLVQMGEVRINEILSAPSSGDEWVEIYNLTADTFALDGWTLTDASEKTTILSGNLTSGSYLIIKNPAGKLNNDGDELTLRNEYADLIDFLAYGTDSIVAPAKDQSLAYTTSGWLPGTPSPNALNPEPIIEPITEHLSSNDEPIYAQDNQLDTSEMDSDSGLAQLEEPQRAASSDATPDLRRIIAIAQPVEALSELAVPEKKPPTASTKQSVTTAIAHVMMNEFASARHGDKVSVTGTVIMEPMKVAKQVMYLEGLEVYFHAADWPKILTGHTVTLTGTVDHDSPNSRLKIATATDIIVQEAEQDILPTNALVSDLAALGSSHLVTVSGELALLTKTGFTLKTTTGDLAINLKAASDVSSSKLTTAAITVTGVLIKNKAGAYEVYPRSAEDLKQDTATKTVPSASIVSGFIAPTTNAFPATTAGLSLGATALGLMGYWLMKTKPELLTSLTSYLETYVR